MEVFQLEQFLAIVQSGSMREAADKLYITRSALSQNMKKLEKSLGCSLFDRTHSPLRLTPYGEIVLSNAQRISNDIEIMLGEIEEQKRVDAATLRVGVFQMMLALLVVPKLARECPDLLYKASVDDGEALIAGLVAGKRDLIMVPDRSTPVGCEKVALGEERAFISIPKSFGIGASGEVRLSDLAGREVVVPKNVPGISSWYRGMLRSVEDEGVRVRELPYDEYLFLLDKGDVVNFKTSLGTSAIASEGHRTNIPIVDECARRSIVAMYPTTEADRLRGVLSFLQSPQGDVFEGANPASFLMYPKSLDNLSFEVY